MIGLERKLPALLNDVVVVVVMLLLSLTPLLFCCCCTRGRLLVRVALASPDRCDFVKRGISTCGVAVAVVVSAESEAEGCLRERDPLLLLVFLSRLGHALREEDPRLSRPKLLERTSGCIVREVSASEGVSRP